MNYRHPGLGRGEPRVRTAGRVPFPLHPLHRLHPLQSFQIAGRLSERVKHKVFDTFCRKMAPTVGLASPKWFLAITCTIWLRFQLWRRGFARFFGARLFQGSFFKNLTRRRPLHNGQHDLYPKDQPYLGGIPPKQVKPGSKAKPDSKQAKPGAQQVMVAVVQWPPAGQIFEKWHLFGK